MGDISTAVGSERISRTVGYQITKGQAQESGVNLPMRIAVLGPANHDNQSALGANPDPKEITSAIEAAEEYGYGSPLHQIARILRPLLGGGIGGIPTVFYPQIESVGATATTIDITVSGTPSKNVTHRLYINGRDNVDGEYYEFTVLTTDTVADIHNKIVDAINAVTGSPVTAEYEGVTEQNVVLTTKWYGATSANLDVVISTNGDAAGLTYVIDDKVDGTGAESITNALAKFGNNWNTVVINPYGSGSFTELETFNGTPSATTPTGRYTGNIFKPFISLFGSVLSDKDDIALITDAAARQDQVTHVLCPAPNSAGFEWEAAANVARLVARTAQDTPHLDVNGQSYPDMPIPLDSIIGDMSDYENRDYLVKHGSSTVELLNGKYTIQDLITTYHPTGELPPQYRYTRNLILDWNVKYGYSLLEETFVKDKAITDNDTTVSVSDVIKPKEWKGILFGYADDLALRALIAEPQFMKDSIEVGVSGTNPDRIETFFRYKRTGTVRIAATTAEANFAFNL